MRAYQPEASINLGSAFSSRQRTLTCRKRGTSAVKPARLRHPLKELHLFVAMSRDLRVRDHVKRHRMALARGKLLGVNVTAVRRQVLNDRQLDRHSNLRAARPTPGASLSVSCMSAISCLMDGERISSGTSGRALCRKTASPTCTSFSRISASSQIVDEERSRLAAEGG